MNQGVNDPVYGLASPRTGGRYACNDGQSRKAFLAALANHLDSDIIANNSTSYLFTDKGKIDS